MESPFQCGGEAREFPPVDKSHKLVIRLEKVTGVQVNIKVGGTAAADNADYFLTGGDALEIIGIEHRSGYSWGSDGMEISVINILGDPQIYWRLE